MNQPIRIIVAAGGTGGDLFPSVAVLEKLAEIRPIDVVFFGNKYRIEGKKVPELGFRFVPISVTGYKGLRNVKTYTLPFTIADSYITVRSWIQTFKPDIAISGGTYISYPFALAASHANIPLVLIESNAIPGKANRFVANRADIIISAFEECAQYFSPSVKNRIHVVGNPIREIFSTVPTQQQARNTFDLLPNKQTVVVVGGSLGARSINQALEHSLPEIIKLGCQVLWQTGNNYTPSPATVQLPHVTITPFIEDMASAYAAADILVARSGGGTVAEIKVIGTPSILVPYPHAANNEQEFNALSLVHHNAARMIRDAEISTKLLPTLQELIASKELLSSMRQSMASLGKPHAAQSAADIIFNRFCL